MGIRLLGNRIAIRMDEPRTVSPGGIRLVKKDPTNTGTVVYVGSGLYDNKNVLIPMVVAVGDRISFLSDNLKEIEIDGEKLMMLTETDIIAILIEKNNKTWWYLLGKINELYWCNKNKRRNYNLGKK